MNFVKRSREWTRNQRKINESEQSVSDATFMSEALRIAEKGLYTADPNPRVGCVLVKDNQIISRGYHLTDGKAHAEANALGEAGSNARGSTAYVTLEPCSFQGRTPSCASALVEAGVVRVVAAMSDPHPKNGGKGFQILKDAGIEVVTPLMEVSARQLNPGHVKRHESGLPFVRLKMAMSLDGKTALGNGKSQWITGPEARMDVQKLRARSSVIVTGVQTIIEDDPLMTVRANEIEIEHAGLSANRKRPVYILDPNLRVSPHARVLQDPNNVLVCGSGKSLGGPVKARIIESKTTQDDRIDLLELLTFLAKEQCNEVLFECGGVLAGSLVHQGLCDELVIYIAPKMMGSSARSLLSMPEIDTMSGLFNVNVTDIRVIGDDIRVTAEPI
jgi:diaminohydroxyphosphoribosylaminopyrimidine deaminase / 5-amino-6-(5-phosphoribosylamino)uracil reductase